MPVRVRCLAGVVDHTGRLAWTPARPAGCTRRGWRRPATSSASLSLGPTPPATTRGLSGGGRNVSGVRTPHHLVSDLIRFAAGGGGGVGGPGCQRERGAAGAGAALTVTDRVGLPEGGELGSSARTPRAHRKTTGGGETAGERGPLAPAKRDGDSGRLIRSATGHPVGLGSSARRQRPREPGCGWRSMIDYVVTMLLHARHGENRKRTRKARKKNTMKFFVYISIYPFKKNTLVSH